MDDDRVQTIAIGTGVMLLVGLLIFLAAYRVNKYVNIQDRYWSYYDSIRWDHDYYVPVTHETCYGTGKDRHCTTTVEMERRASTHIRCQGTQTGRELPTISPKLACGEQIGDYHTSTVTYHVDYTVVGETNKQSTMLMDAKLWDELEPGTRRMVVCDILGNITNMAPEQ